MSKRLNRSLAFLGGALLFLCALAPLQVAGRQALVILFLGGNPTTVEQVAAQSPRRWWICLNAPVVNVPSELRFGPDYRDTITVSLADGADRQVRLPLRVRRQDLAARLPQLNTLDPEERPKSYVVEGPVLAYRSWDGDQWHYLSSRWDLLSDTALWFAASCFVGFPLFLSKRSKARRK